MLGFIRKEEADLIGQAVLSMRRWIVHFNRSQIGPTDAQRAQASERFEQVSERLPTDIRREITAVLKR